MLINKHYIHSYGRQLLTMVYNRWMICLLMILLSSANAAAQKPAYTIRKDGSFDITGTAVTIANCYPAIDNKMVKPLKLSFTKTDNKASITYYLIEGKLELNFSYQENALVIKPTVENNNQPAHFISILKDAEV